ncbi:MAG: hypothetical protein GY710_01520 [Desulfobacteraceae bacterium]|nr:hypothetical protein [Desulfobacteraceae bacterium]
MKSIQAQFQKDPREIKIKAEAQQEDWPQVCHRFNDDVERVCDVTDLGDYTALYQCFDDMNKKSFYLVEEDKALFRMKRRHFLDNIGQTDA